MILAPILLALTTAIAQPADAKEVRKEFVECAAKQDRAACVALWRAHPNSVLGTIDADLEGSLTVREKSKEPDLKKIAEMEARAVWGAEVAFEATGHPIFRDYAASFIGWNDDERKRFRSGQAAFGKAMKALEAKDAPAALAAGTECLQLTGPLGDWWGSAMGCQAIALAQKELGNHEKALESAAFARVLYHDLGLVADEYEVVVLMADECQALKRIPRAKASLVRAIELATRLKDDDGLKRLTDTLAQLDASK
ncbi:MAG: hypothetical protein SGI72_13630 [Planctomycetota bacterium]|nr:hypothetical protein [Planctomycetota bacterium]